MDGVTVPSLIVEDTNPLMFETAGKQRRDDEQRSEWTFHRGIPIEVVNV